MFLPGDARPIQACLVPSRHITSRPVPSRPLLTCQLPSHPFHSSISKYYFIMVSKSWLPVVETKFSSKVIFEGRHITTMSYVGLVRMYVTLIHSDR